MEKPYGLQLEKDEKILWVGKRSLRSLWLPFFIGFVTLPLYGIGILFIVYAIAKWLKTDYIITDRKVVRVTRRYAFVYLISYDIAAIEHERIRSVYSVQKGMGSRFRYWDLIIENGERVEFNGLGDVEEVKRIVEKFRS